MNRRRIAVLVVVGIAAVAVVGLSAAGTMSAGDSARPVESAKGVAPARTTTSPPSVRTPERLPEANADPSSYWTPERVAEAQPIERTVPGGNGTASATRSESTVPGSSAPAKNVSPRKSSASATSGKVVSPKDSPGSGSISGGDPNSYWTPEQIESAQPMERTVPGGNGSEGSSGSSGNTVPGAAP